MKNGKEENQLDATLTIPYSNKKNINDLLVNPN